MTSRTSACQTQLDERREEGTTFTFRLLGLHVSCPTLLFLAHTCGRRRTSTLQEGVSRTHARTHPRTRTNTHTRTNTNAYEQTQNKTDKDTNNTHRQQTTDKAQKFSTCYSVAVSRFFCLDTVECANLSSVCTPPNIFGKEHTCAVSSNMPDQPAVQVQSPCHAPKSIVEIIVGSSCKTPATVILRVPSPQK